MSRIVLSNLSFSYKVKSTEKANFLRKLRGAEYRTHVIFENLNFERKDPGILAIVGSNGSGKTTLIKLLCGLLVPQAGELKVLNDKPSEHNKEFLKRISAVFGQRRMLWPELSLLENFELVSALYNIPEKVKDKRAQELCELFNLNNLLYRPVKTFSLGEAMKAETCAALLTAPELLFLDEPTIGMDLKSQNTMRSALKDYIKRHSCLIILTSHNTVDITELADTTYFLKKGKLELFRATDNDLAKTIESKLLNEED